MRLIKTSTIILLFTLSLVSSSCAKNNSIELNQKASKSPTALPRKPTLISTQLPTKTFLSITTPTILPKPTLPEPLDDFSQARIYSSGPQQGWEFSITLQLHEPIKGKYTAIVGESQNLFICRALSDYSHPERLFCIGRIPAAGKQVEFVIIDTATRQQVFNGNIYAPIP